jgi:hypothetical protein
MRLFDLFEQSGKTAVIGWGRFNPPTIGHQKLVDMINKTASSEKGDAMLFLTKTHDPLTTPTGKPTTKEIKNPLTFDQKLPFAQKFFNINVDTDPNLKTIMSVMEHLQKQGYEKVIIVAGSDRVPEYETLMKQFNGVPDKSGKVNFSISDVQVANAGMRDPDADGVEGMSASKLRQFAKDGDFDNFAKGVPADSGTAQKLYDLVRNNMGIKEPEMAEGMFGIDSKTKGAIQNIVSQLSDIPGMWDHSAQTFTDAGMEKLKSLLKDNPKYIKYAVNLTADDYDESIEMESTDKNKISVPAVKPRDPNWRDMEALRKSGAGGIHKDKRKVIPRKQKYKDVAEGYLDMEVMGHKYMPDLDVEDDNRKIWHTIVTPKGKTISADFTPYSYMDKDDLKLFIKLGYPKRQGSGSLDKKALQQMAQMSGIANLDPEMANAGRE